MHRTQNSQNNLKKNKTKLEDSPLLILKHTTEIKSSRQCCTGLKIDMISGVELRIKTCINPHTYAQLTLDKCVKIIHLGKTVSSTNSIGKKGYLHARE